MFYDIIASNNLLDVNFIGWDFTWCNNQAGLARRWAWLDRYLVNSAWSSKFDSFFIKNISHTFSDHAPIFQNAFPRGFLKFAFFALIIIGLII